MIDHTSCEAGAESQGGDGGRPCRRSGAAGRGPGDLSLPHTHIHTVSLSHTHTYTHSLALSLTHTEGSKGRIYVEQVQKVKEEKEVDPVAELAQQPHIIGHK